MKDECQKLWFDPFCDGIDEVTSWSGKEAAGAARHNEQLGYGYDAAGNLNLRTNDALVQTFTVDSLNQLSSVSRIGPLTVTGATPVPATNVTVNGVAAQTYGDFTFAGGSNTLTNGANTFTIIAQNPYGLTVTNSVSVNLPVTVSPQYDANGNLISDGTRAFSYDAENQLTNVFVTNMWRVGFVYDGLNRRRIERDYTWQSGSWVETNEIRYIYDGRVVLQERNSNNVPQATYTRGLDLSLSLQGAGGIGGLLARSDATGNYYFHSDASGNVTGLIDGNGNMAARYEYDPFGRMIGMWGTMADANRYRFSSKEYDSLSGLYYYGARFYDPTLQRFLNRDPIGEFGGFNLYRAMGNNPVNMIDPYGFSWLNPFSYSSGWAQSQGAQALNAQLAANGYAGVGDFQQANPTWNGNGNLTAGNMQAVQGAANLGAAAANGEINLYGAILPGGIAAKEGEEAAAAARAASKECPQYPKIGYKGTKPYRDAMKAIQNGGTHVNLGFVPTETQARQLLEDAGVDLSKIRVEDPHLPPNPHDYPHINYPTPGGGKGTIPIQ